MSLSVLSYLSVTKDEKTYDVTLDEKHLRHIRSEYKKIYPKDNTNLTENQLKELTLKKLAEGMNLKNDPINMGYLNICVSEETEEDAKTEIIDKFKGSVEYSQPNTTSDSAKYLSMRTTNGSEVLQKQQNDASFVLVDQITCLIYKYSDKPEVNNFMKAFLFHQIHHEVPQGVRSANTPLYSDNAVHLLPKGTLIDLFLRQQLAERNVIISIGERTKFRLIEPVSLTDEFSTWTYDHFQQLFDFWLTYDQGGKQPFPTRWKITDDAIINYRIVSHSIGASSASGSLIQRPSTKSLDTFIRDICKLEDNHMFKNWYDSLTLHEDVTTYSHLSNLTQKEWDGIKKLSMNAVKTIKFYVDQAKQLNAIRKRKLDKDDDKEPELTHCELLAKLHMIKLYIIRQLEYEKGIEDIPQLERECVEGAFDEMRREGYEDDGLFDDMKLFFQPPTITNDELKITENETDKANRGQQLQKENLFKDIDVLQKQFNKLFKEIHDWSDLIAKTKRLAHEEQQVYEQKMQKKTLSYEARTQLNFQWCSKDTNWQKEIDYYKRQIRINDQKIKEIESTIMEIESLLKTIDENLLTSPPKIKEIESTIMETESLLKTIDENLSTSPTKINRNLIQLHRGFIMYGPPGTGKSHLMSKLAKKIGIAMLAPPLASGNLERSLVGQSEAVISSLCRRANRLPHLICCLSIDEIDSLAPRRDEKSSEGKVSKISVLLSVLEGAENIPNLMFFSATNLLHRMDEAFLRRMTGKFFVGRPSSESRKRMLSKIPKTILSPKTLETLVIATTNFSGSALSRLISEITTEHRCKIRSIQDFEITDEIALVLADRTAKNYQLKMGLDTLPRLQLRNYYDRQRLRNQRTTNQNHNQVDALHAFHLPKGTIFTGKIVVSLSDRCIRIEAIQKNNELYIIEEKFRETEQNLQQLLERITTYGTDRNVQLLQLIDLNLLSSKGAHDEQKISEVLKECYDECTSYRRSMIVYDLDSLVGVNKSESDSSMGTSVSSSVVNQHIYLYVTNRFGEAKILDNIDKNLRTEQWAIAIVRDSFLLKKFTTETNFTPTSKQQEEEEEEHRKATETLACVKCRDYYIESENKIGQCTYHDGFVYDNSSLTLTKYRPSDALEELNRDEFQALQDWTTKEQKEKIEHGKTRMKYICCGAIVQTGGLTGGCKKGRHGFNDLQRRNNRSELEDADIKVWEDACFENIKWNQRHNDLFGKRKL